MTLSEKYGGWALVAGASEGLGAAFARALSNEGFKVVLVARRREALEEVARSLKTDAKIVVADLADGVPEVEEDVGLVVYNAALSLIGDFHAHSLEEQLRVVDVNVRGPVRLAHVYGKKMKARGRGGIVLMSSLTAMWGAPYIAAYGASKAFNLGLAEALWYELKPTVDVIACCAGATDTPGFRKSGGKNTAQTPEAVVNEALRRLGTRPSFVAGFLNKCATFVLRRMPRAVVIGILGKETRKLHGVLK